MSRCAAAVLCAVVLFGLAVSAGAQSGGTQPGGTQPGGAPAAAGPDHVPQPYAPGEFPGWLSDVWRAEAIFVGSFPFALFVTLEVYDSWRYFANDLKPMYAPWPFGSGAAAAYSSTETQWLAVAAISLSLAVSGIDFILGRLNDESSRR